MNRRIAILGCGKIGESLLGGLLSANWRKPAEVAATCRREERIGELRGHFGVDVTLSNGEAAAGAGLVVIAVKPQDIEALLGEVGPLLTTEQTVLSVAAAIPTAAVERQIASGIPVVRAMPNTPATVHEGIAGICPGAHAGEENLAVAADVLGHVGQDNIEWLNIVTNGANCGWSFYEGTRRWTNSLPPGFNLTPRIFEYGHTNGRVCVIGGVVYRGARLSQLYGAYTYADYGSGEVWALRTSGFTATQNTLLLTDSGANLNWTHIVH